MNIDKEFIKVLASGDERAINEIVALSSSQHKNYEEASKNPHEWGIWASTNPRDALALLTQWVSNGKDVSGFADNYAPELTPCETFANALGFAIHLHLKKFKFRDNGDYMEPIHMYSTTPVRNGGKPGGVQTSGSIGQSVINREEPSVATPEPEIQIQGDEEVFNTYKQRMLTAINNNNRTELASVYNEIMAKPELTNKQKMELKRIYSTAKSAIRNQQRADRQTSKGYVNMANKSWDRADRKYNKVDSNQTLTDLNEVKSFIKKTMLSEMKKIK